MNQWDVWTCDFVGAGPHPAVIISHSDRVARAPLVSVLIGSSQKVSRSARENEVVLNGADGLDWETLVKCDLMYRWRRSGCIGAGAVSAPRGAARRRALVQRINACFGFTLV